MNRIVKGLLWTVFGVTVVVVGLVFAATTFFFGNPLTRPRYPKYEALLAAVESHDAVKVRTLLAHGTDPNEFPNDPASIQAESDLSILNDAVDEGNEDVVKALLDYHADPNLGDGWHDNPLSAAAANNNVSMMKLLVARGAKINDNSDGSSALWRAAMDGKVEATAFLLTHGASPNTSFNTSKPNEPILEAVRSVAPNPAIIALLKKAGAR